MEPYDIRKQITDIERSVITDNTKTLILGIIGVLLLLSVCVSVDYADENITVMNENISTCDVKVNDTSKVVGLDETNSSFVVKSSDKIYTIKEKTKKVSKLPVITITAKPSVRSNYAYRWYTMTWIDYCPNCHHYNCLLINPKCVPERELTCKICDSDFCGVTGKEKYSWSRVYLRRA